MVVTRKEVKSVGSKDYLCELTSNINEGDLIIRTFESTRQNKTVVSLNKVTFTNRAANVFRYDRISDEGPRLFGIDKFTSMTDMSKYMGIKCIFKVELNTLFTKVIREC
jgi:hypothetical protein